MAVMALGKLMVVTRLVATGTDYQYVLIQEIFQNFFGRLRQGNIGSEHRDGEQ